MVEKTKVNQEYPQTELYWLL